MKNENSNPLAQRIMDFINLKELEIPDFSKQLGYKQPEKLYRLFRKGKANPSVEIISDISNSFEDLNIKWLLTGIGNPLINENSFLIEKDIIIQSLKEKISIKNRRILELKAQVKLLEDLVLKKESNSKALSA
jgi:hypothetical protein